MRLQLTIVLVFLLMFVGCSSFVKPLPFSKPSLSSRIDFINTNTIDNEDIVRAIRKGDLVEGMTKEQVLASWGEPGNRNEDTWYYNGWMHITVVFKDGHLVEVYGYT